MSLPVKRSLSLLAGELGVSLAGLDDDELDAVAIRFVLEERVNADVLQGLVDDVRHNERGEGPANAGAGVSNTGTDKSGSPVSLAPPSPPKRPYRFNSTEATEAKMKRRLALAHRTEDSRTGLYLVPRRPGPLPVDKPHPPCLVAARDGGTPCSRCEWLLGDDEYAEQWLDRDDDTIGGL